MNSLRPNPIREQDLNDVVPSSIRRRIVHHGCSNHHILPLNIVSSCLKQPYVVLTFRRGVPVLAMLTSTFGVDLLATITLRMGRSRFSEASTVLALRNWTTPISC